MRFSIIIPAYNAEETLGPCLEAIFTSEEKDFEVLVVDANSTDKSMDIAARYPCRSIKLEKNKGAAYSRNTGSCKAKGEILLFIDHDVLVEQYSLGLIDKDFKENTDITAVTGMLSKACPHKGFFTQYKNLYMHYIFKRCPRYVDFLYGSIMAIKKDFFLRFDESNRVEDTELGQRYNRLNKKIVLNPKLEVTHLKKYGLISILINDFHVPFWWVRSFILHEGWGDLLRKKRFSHARLNQMISIMVSYMLIPAAIIWVWSGSGIFFLALMAVYILLNYKFFRFLYREKGLLFSMASALFTYLDMLIMGLGVISGFIYFNIRTKRI